MRIGLFTASQWQQGDDPARVLSELRQMVRAGRDNGFASLLVGQHLLTAPMGMFQTMPLLGQLAEDSGTMQLGPGVQLLGMMNPVLAAEEGATLDWLTGGRYVLCAGLGYRPEEFQAMGVQVRQRVGRLTEGVEVIRRLWTEERVSFQGTHFRLENAGASVRPKQQPRPPIWLGGDVEPAVRRAARIADAWCSAPTLSLDSLLRYLEAFRDERQKHGLAPAVCPVIRECFVGRDAAHAQSVSRGPLLFKYRAYASWGQGETTTGNFDDAYDAFAAERFLIGDARQVRESLLRYAEATGSDHFLLRVQWPGLAHPEVLGCIERLGRIIADLG